MYIIKMKRKKYHSDTVVTVLKYHSDTVVTVLKYHSDTVVTLTVLKFNQRIVDTETKSIPLTDIYMIITVKPVRAPLYNKSLSIKGTSI